VRTAKFGFGKKEGGVDRSGKEGGSGEFWWEGRGGDRGKERGRRYIGGGG